MILLSVGTDDEEVDAEAKLKPLVLVANIPSPLDMTTSSGPRPAGVVARMVVLLTSVLDALEFPNFTVEDATNPVPVMVTLVPPMPGPELGSMVAIVAANTVERPVSTINTDTVSVEVAIRRAADNFFIGKGLAGNGTIITNTP